MNLTDEQKQELYLLQMNVTHFSEQLRTETKHEQEVVIGGRITNIVLPLDEQYPMYIVMLDDLIGTTHVYVPNTMMEAYLDHFQIGKTVFVEGFVNVMTRHIKKEKKKDVTIFAYSMKDITKVGDTE